MSYLQGLVCKIAGKQNLVAALAKKEMIRCFTITNSEATLLPTRKQQLFSANFFIYTKAIPLKLLMISRSLVGTQVGLADSCILWSHMHGMPPDWGLSGNGDEENTQNIMCCLAEALTEEDVSYEAVEDRYKPLSFNRSNGWTGSYPEAVHFCGAIEGGSYGLCPYKVVCPLGPDREPLGGAIGDEPEAWLPVLDGINEWVQVGQSGSLCIAWSHKHPGQPDWSMTGQGSEEFTQNINCCLVTEETSRESDALLYELAMSKFRPHIYDRSHGWEGQTFEAALDFCDGIEGYELCPYGKFRGVLLHLSCFEKRAFARCLCMNFRLTFAGATRV